MSENFDLAKKQYSRVGRGLLIYSLGGVVVQIVAVFVLMFAKDTLAKDQLFNLILSIVATFALAIPLAVLYIRKGERYTFGEGRMLSFKEMLLAFFIMYGVTFVGGLLGNGVMGLFTLIRHKSFVDPASAMLSGGSPVVFWLQIFMVAIAAPIMEELLFRKTLIDAVEPFGHGAAIFISALTFGLAHGNFFQFFYTFGVGLIFAYIYIKTGRVRNTIILHFLLNVFGGVIPSILQRIAGPDVKVLEGDSIAATFRALSESGGKAIPSLVYTVIMLAVEIAGIVLLIVNRKKFKFGTAPRQLPKGEAMKAAFVNVGMILYLIICTVTFALMFVE